MTNTEYETYATNFFKTTGCDPMSKTDWEKVIEQSKKEEESSRNFWNTHCD
jgi:hypothetical protein